MSKVIEKFWALPVDSPTVDLVSMHREQDGSWHAWLRRRRIEDPICTGIGKTESAACAEAMKKMETGQ